MNSQLKPPLPHIFSEFEDWPIFKLTAERQQFIELCAKEILTSLRRKLDSARSVKSELERTIYREEIRLTKRAWKADTNEEKKFWKEVKSDFNSGQNAENENLKLLEKIVSHYLNEIAGEFKTGTYKFAQGVVPFALNRLLNASNNRNFNRIWGNRLAIHDRFHILGDLAKIRKLALNNTIVMVPTHFSNLDSVIMGFVIDAIGLPAFLYGAGLNLFGIKLLAYFMNRLGAYKVDRRKINLIYLEALRHYSSQAMCRGCHSLFFPRGTRSRSGGLEKVLKYGLIESAVTAQRMLLQSSNSKNKKIIFVPVVISYHFTPEAPVLIDDYLKGTGKNRKYEFIDEYSNSYKTMKFIFNLVSASSEITISFGDCIDVFGNSINETPDHLQSESLSDKFIFSEIQSENDRQDAEIARQLSGKILAAFFKYNCVLSSHLIAFTAFELIRKKYYQLELEDVLNLPESYRMISKRELADQFQIYYKKLIEKEKKELIRLSAIFAEGAEATLASGLANIGTYHSWKVLWESDQSTVQTDNLKLLYYYRNRLVGFGLGEI